LVLCWVTLDGRLFVTPVCNTPDTLAIM
jgi:hypothetical protein